MYVEFLKNSYLTESSELMAVRVISVCWAPPKTFDSYFLDMMYVEFMKNFLSRRFDRPDRCYTHFDHPEPKSVWFLLSRHDVGRVHEKFSFSPTRASWWLLESFRHPEPKNVWLLLSRHDVRRILEKFVFSLIRASWWLLDLFRACWAQKRLIPTFETWCTSSSWKIFFSPIRTSCWLLDSFWPPVPKNVWFQLSRHDVRRVHEKFSSRRFERAVGC